MIPTAPTAGRMPTPGVEECGSEYTFWELDQLLDDARTFNAVFRPDEILGLHKMLDRLRLRVDDAYRKAQYGKKPA